MLNLELKTQDPARITYEGSIINVMTHDPYSDITTLANIATSARITNPIGAFGRDPQNC